MAQEWQRLADQYADSTPPFFQPTAPEQPVMQQRQILERRGEVLDANRDVRLATQAAQKPTSRTRMSLCPSLKCQVSTTCKNAGGFDLICDGGVTLNTIVNGGTEVVEGKATGLISGTAVSTTVNGGVQIVFGVADFTTVNNGFEVVWSGGFAGGTTVNGKDSFDFVVGTTFGDVINNGTEFVVSGGFASGTTVN